MLPEAFRLCCALRPRRIGSGVAEDESGRRWIAFLTQMRHHAVEFAAGGALVGRRVVQWL